MKELTRKMLVAGLIDKTTTSLMERWGQLDTGATDILGKEQLTKKTLESFVEELELLLQPEALERGVAQLDPPAVLIDRKQGD